MSDVLDSELQYIPGQQTIDGDEVAAPPPLDEPRVAGTTRLEQHDLGGKLPMSAVLKLRGGSIRLLDGQAFDKGDTVRLLVTVEVGGVAQRDKRDRATGIVMSCVEEYAGDVTDIEVVE